MSLKNKFNSFLKKQEEAKSNLREVIIHNREAINLGYNVVHALKNFYVEKTPYSLAEGAIDILREMILDKAFFAGEYFTEKNGWVMVTFGRFSLDGFFRSVIEKYPSKPFRFENDSAKVRFVQLPFAEVAYVESSSNDGIFYRQGETTSEAVFEFLVDEKFKEVNSNFIGFGYAQNKKNFNEPDTASIYAEPLNAIESPKADYYTKYIRKYLDKGISRSLLLYGSPGTGKTSVSQAIVKNLGFRTLKFRFDHTYDYNLFYFLITQFKIEAVILDDFDQINADKEVLELLEMLKRETKLVIGIVNSLQEFHPAILRPGRMDEIILIDALEPEVVKQLLGPLHERFGERVANWPVAYINELVARSQVVTDEELEEAYVTLDKRAVDQKTEEEGY
jgi:hypothetical protein